LNARDPNAAKLELVARALGSLRERVVFVGGCAVGLLITDEAAAPVRVTMDVDLVAPVSALSAYHGIEQEMSKQGFKRDLSATAPICRWRYRGLEVDVMPADPKILGFANRWYPLAVESARSITLPLGTVIRLVTAPVFVATKFEAYADRGGGDLLASHDLEDIINVLDGRASLLHEIAESPRALREYLRTRCQALLKTPNFSDYLPGLVASGDDQADRAKLIEHRLSTIARGR
jgi:predicted nucleotidyltransferase